MIVTGTWHGKPFSVVVDDDDAEILARYPRPYLHKGYPHIRVGKRPMRRNVALHMFLLGPAPAGLEWDHIDRDKLNNRRSNFRAVAHAVNIANSGKRRNNTSGVQGVSWHRDRNGSGCWTAYIRRGGPKKYLGRFRTIEEATAARVAAEAQP